MAKVVYSNVYQVIGTKKRFYYADLILDNGKRIRKSTKETNQAAAWKKLETFKKQAESDIPEERKETRFFSYAQEYLNLNAKPTAIWRIGKETYLKTLKECFGDIRLIDFTKKKIEEFKSERLRAPLKKITKKDTPIRTVSPGTINKELGVLKALLNHAVENEYLEKNPAESVKFFSEEAYKRTRFLTREEFGDLIGACKSPLKEFLIVLANTAMRPGEARKLKWLDYKFERDQAYLGLKLTKNGKQRIVYLNPVAKAAIDTLPKGQPCDYIFPGKGKSGAPYDFRRPFRNAATKAGLNRPGEEKVVPYHIRHYAISNLGRSGADLRLGMEFAGHSTLRAHERYRHFYDSDKIEAAKLLQHFVMPTNLFVTNPVTNAETDKTSIWGHSHNSLINEGDKNLGGTGFEPVTPTMSR